MDGSAESKVWNPLLHQDRAALFQANTTNSATLVFLTFILATSLIGGWAGTEWGSKTSLDMLGLFASATLVSVAQIALAKTIRKNRADLFFQYGFAAGVVKLLWVQVLAWSLPPSWDFASAAVLCSLIVGWALGDAIYMFDAPPVRISWAIGLLTLPFYLSLVDLLGPDDPPVLNSEADRVLNFSVAICILQLTTQGVFHVVGKDARIAQANRDRQATLQREHEALKSERETISRVAKVLSGTVAGQRLRHDAASPLQVLGFGLDALGEEGPAEERDEILGDMRQALTSLESLVTSLRTDTEEDVGSLTAVEALIERTLSSVRGTLLGHQVKAAPVNVEVETAEVWSGPEHPVAIASLICNASLLAPELPVTVRGRVVNPYFYRLEIRDQAAIGEAQRTGYERVRLGLRLRRMGTDSRGGRWRGMGIGLPLCRLQLSRHGSWVDVSLPETGPGLVLQVIMPRVEPATIPESENTPERWVIA